MLFCSFELVSKDFNFLIQKSFQTFLNLVYFSIYRRLVLTILWTKKQKVNQLMQIHYPTTLSCLPT